MPPSLRPRLRLRPRPRTRATERPVGFFVAALVLAAPAARGEAADAVGGGAFAHVRALQAIAEANGGNRAAGTPGYDRSAEYVAARLRDAGYEVRFEEFALPFFEERSPPRLLRGPADIAASQGGLRTFVASGSGDVTARLHPVALGLPEGADPGAAPPASTSACQTADFDGFERGTIALVRRGGCTFQTKVDLAVAAGAAGVVVMNEGTQGRTGVVAGRLNASPIPVVGVGYALGRTLAAEAIAGRSHAVMSPKADRVGAAGDGAAGVVRLTVEAVSGTRPTRNVLAELGGPGPGDMPGDVIVVGAHLDGVPEGPGINDNASGSAAVLDVASRLARAAAASNARPTRRVRFAFWGAEEAGLVGSRHHLDALPDERRREIKLYINLDMVGSPNFGRFVQGTPAGAPEGARADDDALAATARRGLLDAFRSRGLSVEERLGRGPRGYGSDDASFARWGIPTVGLHTGADARKSDEAAALFGGTAGQAYDPCYHRACDTADNIAPSVLEQMTQALARVVAALTGMAEPGPAPGSEPAESRERAGAEP